MIENQNLRNVLVRTSTYSNILVCTDSYQSCKSVCKYILVQTCTYQLIPAHQYMQVHTSTDQYIPAHTRTFQYTVLHTCMYWLVLVCTSTYQEFLDSQKVQTEFEPVILCILFVYSTAALRVHSNEFRVSIKGNVGVYINLVLFMSVYLALDDELTAPDPLHRPRRP